MQNFLRILCSALTQNRELRYGHNPAILNFSPIGLKFFMGTQETIIYRLVMRSSSYDAYFSFLIFWATFGGKMGVAIMRAPNGLGPPNLTKKFALSV